MAARHGDGQRLAAALCALAREREASGVVRRRVFLVGCPRSGTTLLQSLLHAHREILSLPETHFFQQLLASDEARQCERPEYEAGLARRRWRERKRRALAAVGLVAPQRVQRAWRSLAETGLDAHPPAGLDRWRLRAHARAFTHAMDVHCLQHRKSVWLEKTPDHLYYIEAIRQHLPDARFIHVVRDGEEVVASLHRAAQAFAPWRPYLDVERCVSRWSLAVAESLRWIDDPRHRLVRYEDLVAAPQLVLHQVLGFLGCADDPRLWERYTRAASELILPDEPWKRGNLEPIALRRRFEATFDAVQQRRIRERLSDVTSRARADGVPPMHAAVNPR